VSLEPATYRLTIAPGDEQVAARLLKALEDDLETRGAADGLSLSYYEDDGDGWLVEIIGAEVPEIPALRAAARKVFGNDASFPTFSVSRMPDIDWVAHSQQGLPPVRAGAFVVHGSHDRERAHGPRLGIQIDAGEAFGTAHHGTTLGCLIALDWLSRLRPLGNVLDLGTGSGVLAIAAAKRGARVLATDIEATAVRVAHANISLNGAERAVACVQANGLQHRAVSARAPYDLVLANILAEPLMSMADGMRRATGPGAIIVLSGLLQVQGWRVTRRFNTAGFMLRRRIDRAGWTTLVMIRRRDLPARQAPKRTLLR